MSLTQIGKRWGTDKVDPDHTFFGKTYMDIYEKYFEEMRYTPIKFLEIGILGGSSLASWRDYFPNAEIHGIDINPMCKRFENKEKNIFVHIVDCSDEEKLKEFASMFNNYFDVILDDGSHINNITLKTFKHLYSACKPSSYYIVEDLGCAYLGDDFLNHVQHWPGCDLIKYKEKDNNPDIFFELLKEIHTTIDLVKWKPEHMVGWKPTYHIEYLHHHPYIIVMKKNEHYKQ